MDFTNRTQQNQVHHADSGSRPAGPVTSQPSSSSKPPKKSRQLDGSKWWRVGGIIFLFAVVILAIAVLLYIGFVNPSSQKYIKTDKYQAVVLTNGQSYFGHLVGVNSEYYDLRDIFYLQAQPGNKKSSDTKTSLVKLGCFQVHDPYDQMIIQTSNVSYWENLQDNGQVVTAINNYYKQNPDGPKCVDRSGANTDNQPASNPSSNSTQNSANTNSSTQPNSSTSSSSSNTTPSNKSSNTNTTAKTKP